LKRIVVAATSAYESIGETASKTKPHPTQTCVCDGFKGGSIFFRPHCGHGSDDNSSSVNQVEGPAAILPSFSARPAQWPD
jgi:hypothetical protein